MLLPWDVGPTRTLMAAWPSARNSYFWSRQIPSSPASWVIVESLEFIGNFFERVCVESGFISKLSNYWRGLNWLLKRPQKKVQRMGSGVEEEVVIVALWTPNNVIGAGDSLLYIGVLWSPRCDAATLIYKKKDCAYKFPPSSWLINQSCMK